MRMSRGEKAWMNKRRSAMALQHHASTPATALRRHMLRQYSQREHICEVYARVALPLSQQRVDRALPLLANIRPANVTTINAAVSASRRTDTPAPATYASHTPSTRNATYALLLPIRRRHTNKMAIRLHTANDCRRRYIMRQRNGCRAFGSARFARYDAI